MYFKRLEIVGFKSFPNKTRLDFEPGVTAIVGPNGCGKSNLADAIKWVLGEQSVKSLRGSRMEDVIFNGTDAAEPINMAEVSLTLCNKNKSLPIDYEEVTIARRLFRTGESEYLLNKTPVRLKDIAELLMGTGIGADSYSIIEQGKIDLILSSRPEDRRFIFEEASGITKYKAKKKEALRKLEHTENNLLRINDIITEVKRQLQYIERQAKKAERYKADFEVLKDLEIKHSFYEYRNLANSEKALVAEGSDILAQEKELEEELAKFRLGTSNLKFSLDALNREFFEIQQKITEAEAAYDRDTHKIDINKERLRELEASSKMLAKEIDEYSARLKAAKDDASALKEELSGWQEEVARKESVVSIKEAGIKNIEGEMAAHKKDIEKAKEKILDLMTNETRAKNELIKLNSDIQNRRSRLKRLSMERENVLEEKNNLENDLCLVNEDFEKKEKALRILLSELCQANESHKALSDEFGNVSALLQEKRKEALVLASREELLREIAQKREGFDKAVRVISDEVKKQEPSICGVVGILADMLAVEGGFEACVESALGSMAQAVVVDTRQNAEKIAEFLRDKNSGGINLIVLEELPLSAAEAEPHQDGLELLSRRVDIKNNDRDIIDYVMPCTYFLDDKSRTKEPAVKFAGRRTIVSKDGALTRKGFLFSPGLKEIDSVSILGREQRLEGIAAKRKTCLSDEETLASKEKNLRLKVDALRTRISGLEKETKAKEIDLGNVSAKKSNLEGALRKIGEEISIIEMERDEAHKLIEEELQRCNELNDALSRLQVESQATHDLITSSQGAINKKAEVRETMMLEAAHLKAGLSGAKERRDSLEANFTRLELSVNEFESQAASRNSLIEQGLRRSNELGNENVELEAEILVISDEKRFLQGKKKELEGRKGMVSLSVAACEKELVGKESRLNNLKNQIRDIDVKRAEINFKKEALRTSVLQAYKIAIDEIQRLEIDERTDWDEVRTKIGELKAHLEGMGPVNLVAIDEHKELEERHSFLTKQERDLVQAKESLHKAIIKINATTKKLFIETFGKIQVEFKNYFRMLFGGGQAELILLDEHDVLECGIEIVARPPGKKLQNIMLLSGGEKAMTAISLLLSIFKVNPSPFCVLDEIDAPLDEPNVERFSRVLQEFLKMSQFIIITHNKKTIELADILYGITMQEKGISKIVSVKLKESGEREKSTVFA